MKSPEDKAAIKVYMKRYRERNKERIRILQRVYNKRYYALNKERLRSRINAYARKYRELHREKTRIYHKYYMRRYYKKYKLIKQGGRIEPGDMICAPIFGSYDHRLMLAEIKNQK